MRCPLCGKKLWNPMSLPKHMKGHLEEGQDFLAEYAEVQFNAPPEPEEAE